MSASIDIFGVSVNPQQIVSIEVRTAFWVKVVVCVGVIYGLIETFVIPGLERTADQPALWTSIGGTIVGICLVILLGKKMCQRVVVRLSNGQTLKGPQEWKTEAQDTKLSIIAMMGTQ